MKTENFWTVQKFCFRLVGHKLIENESYMRKIAQIFIIIVTTSSLYPQMNYVYYYHSNILTVTEILCTSLTTIITGCKSVIFMRNKKKILQLLKNLKDVDLNAKSQYEMDIIDKQSKFAKKYLQSFSMFAFGTGFYYVFSPLLKIIREILSGKEVARQQIFKMKFPFDSNQSPAYEIIYFYTAALIFFTVMFIISLDGIYMASCTDLKGHFSIIQARIKNFVFNENKVSLQEELKSFVQYYNNLFYLCQNLRKLYEPIIFVQFLLSSLQLCLILFQLLRKTDDLTQVLIYATYFFAIVYQVLIYCYGAEMIRTESQKIAYSIYSSNWSNWPINEQKMIIFMIKRSQRSIKMNAGFYEGSLETFLSIMKGTASYVALVQTLDKK